MKELKTNINGGFPFVLDDIRWMHDGYKEAFNALISPLSKGQNCIVLSGCEINPNNSVNSGWLWWDGELLYLPGYSSSSSSVNNIYIVKDVTYDSMGLKTFQSGVPQQHDTYQITQAKVVISQAMPVGSKKLITILSFYDIIRNNMKIVKPMDWQIVATDTSTTDPQGPAMVCLDTNGFVHFKGIALNPSQSLSDPIITLPVWARPANYLDFIYLVLTPAGSSALFFNIHIRPDGNVYSSDNPTQVYNCIQFPSFKAGI